jgi:hypothetical protein
MSELAYRLRLQQRALARTELHPRTTKFHFDAAVRIAQQIFCS